MVQTHIANTIAICLLMILCSTVYITKFSDGDIDLSNVIKRGTTMPTINKEIIVGYNTPVAQIDEYTKIRYESVTTIAYFRIIINVDGSLSPSYMYDPEPLVQYAHARGVKVILGFGVYSTEPNNTDVILGDSIIRSAAIKNILDEVVAKNFDGVANDIENMNKINTVTGTPNRDLMTTFQRELSTELWKINPNYKSNIYIGWENWNNEYDIISLNNHVNYFIIMAYGFGRGETSTNAGSYTPIIGYNNTGDRLQCIRSTLDHWYGFGLDKNKTILGISYEGYEWPTVDDARLSNTIGPAKLVKYDIIIDNISQYRRIWDNEWKTPYFVIQANGQWQQMHIDDVQSLGIKYDLVNLEGLAGIAIWSIEEGTDRLELWKIIQDKFSVKIVVIGESILCTALVAGIIKIIPTGDIAFDVSKDNGGTWEQIGTVKTIDNEGKVISDPYIPLVFGNYLFRAKYSGDNNYKSSQSNDIALTVDKANSTTVLFLS